uniref:Lipocalin-like domain-containing protein n=1 Tax=Candidatus Kentrum sp. LPFa TaxID=2126335 RepID=A0A450WL61_9GAMM|nr:MAG: Lipocalin-like domain-containing protein [Candidatus Kentron sp. LPFa]VFK31766.1 MAG: Lipocalin-like domain-containing protein [Candidatus Kentron sp. LPFa]
MNIDRFVGSWKLISFELHRGNSYYRKSGGEAGPYPTDLRRYGGAFPIKPNEEIIFPIGQAPDGCLMYDEKGNMSAMIARAERPLMNTVERTCASIKEKGAAFDSFEAYFGVVHSIDETEKVITHRIGQALFPNWTGSLQKRFYSFKGDRLELSTPPMEYAGNRAIAVLLWERL